MNILIVRLGALGDVVHAIPAAAALRGAFPDARIDWLVDARHRDILDLVTVLDNILVVERGTIAGWTEAVRRLRQTRYDVALDLQGLLKSAIFARASGAQRIIGFSIWHLREKTARPFYSETDSGRGRLQPDADLHVVHKNLHLLRTIGVESDRIDFPLGPVESRALDAVRSGSGPDRPFALINPGAAWPNKRWPPERFAEVAAFLAEVRGMQCVVLWGPGEQDLARAVVDASGGSAHLGPPTTIPDLVALSRAAALIVSGDTGPLHIAAATATPAVAIFGPTDPGRNGPWSSDGVVVSRYTACGCHYQRRCHQAAWCLQDISVAEVTAAIQQRLSRV